MEHLDALAHLGELALHVDGVLNAYRSGENLQQLLLRGGGVAQAGGQVGVLRRDVLAADVFVDHLGADVAQGGERGVERLDGDAHGDRAHAPRVVLLNVGCGDKGPGDAIHYVLDLCHRVQRDR